MGQVVCRKGAAKGRLTLVTLPLGGLDFDAAGCGRNTEARRYLRTHPMEAARI